MTETKTDIRSETWMSWLALTTAILAVLAAVTTLYMGKFSSRAILDQGQETNQWSYYQAKSIKSYIYEIQKQQLELELVALQDRPSGTILKRTDQLIAEYGGRIKRYDQEKEDIKAKAEDLMRDKEIAQKRAGNFGYGLIFLQIAIMLSSIAALTKKKHLYQFSLITVIGWLYYFLDAFFLFL